MRFIDLFIHLVDITKPNKPTKMKNFTFCSPLRYFAMLLLVFGATQTAHAQEEICAPVGESVILSGYDGILPFDHSWGRGTVADQNTISSANGSSYSANDTQTTNYWYRRRGIFFGGVYETKYFKVIRTSRGPGAINAPDAMCGAGAVTLSATGGALVSGGQYQWGTGNVPGQNIVQTGTSSTYTTYWLTATTTYWVRTVDNTSVNPCGKFSEAKFHTVTVSMPSTAPTWISGNNSTCSGAPITITAEGASLSPGATYQWGTGSVGNNVISTQTGQSLTVSPTSNTTYWVRVKSNAPCNFTAAVTKAITVTPGSTAPTSINGPTAVCFGTGGTTLTAQGGTHRSGAVYQWGTGSIPGQNIISGVDYNGYYVNPTVTTTYWVRRYDASCNSYTGAATKTVTVKHPSVQPTGIEIVGANCSGSGYQFKAIGGTPGTDAVYQWGTGWTVGQNIIPNSNSQTITLNPAAHTGVWVRFLDSAPCAAQSWGAYFSMPATVTVPGSTLDFGNNEWRAYGFAGGNISLNGSYRGFYTMTGLNFNTSTSTTGWPTTGTPSSAAGWSGCPVPSDEFAMTIKRRGFPCGRYQLTMNDWDDAAQVYVNGNLVWNCAVWNGANSCSGNVGQFNLDANATVEVRFKEDGGHAIAALSFNKIDVAPTAPTSVTASQSTVCANAPVTLTASGGSNGTFGIYQWGRGSAPNNILGTSTSPTFVVSSPSSGNYWVRRIDSHCGNATAAVSVSVTIFAAPTNPATLTASTNSICPGTSVTLTAAGGNTGANGQFQWGSGTVSDANAIATTTASTFVVTPMANTTYWVRRIDPVCGTATAHRSVNITMASAGAIGSVSPVSQVICRNSVPTQNITHNTGNNILGWQVADDAAFTLNLRAISFTGQVLTPAMIGSLTQTAYVRAVIQGNCAEIYSPHATISVPAPVVYNGTWSQTPSIATPIIIASDFTMTNDISACDCEVINNATVTIAAAKTLTVKRSITVQAGASIIVENRGGIVQIDDDAVNTGNITQRVTSTRMKNFDFSYWSSPVTGTTLKQMSPATLHDKYYSFSPMINNWVVIPNGNAQMEKGRGYIVRAPQGWSQNNATQGRYTAEFTGVPNNGVVLAPIAKGNSTFNLIGNPYPSAIDIDEFITHPDNQNLIEGTVYVWTHNTALAPQTGGTYQYTADDYAKYNLTGGVSTGTPGTGNVIPTGKISAGQGFFIEVNSALANGSYAATFTNSMRERNHIGQFFRTSNEDDFSASEPQPQIGLEKHRLWLNLTNANGAFNQTLVGYIEGATDGYDRLFDGAVFSAANVVSLYTMVNNVQMSIQGRALPFSSSDVVPLGFKSTIAGEFSISLSQFDGLFDTQNVYLFDQQTQTYHDLKEGAYTFLTSPGTFENRFELRYANQTLGTGDHLTNPTAVQVIAEGTAIRVKSSQEISEVSVFDLIGRQLLNDNQISGRTYNSRDLNCAAQVIIVHIKHESGFVHTQKVMVHP